MRAAPERVQCVRVLAATANKPPCWIRVPYIALAYRAGPRAAWQRLAGPECPSNTTPRRPVPQRCFDCESLGTTYYLPQFSVFVCTTCSGFQ